VAAVLVHIDLDGARAHASSLQALAAGRAVASSWGATLYAAVVVHDPTARERAEAAAAAAANRDAPIGPVRVPGDARTIEAIRAALAHGGADKIVVALTDAAIEPLWSALGTAWQGVLDRLRPRLVVFGANAPSADELGPRTAARIGARLFLRARTAGADEVELRDRDGSYVRAQDSGAAVALIGAAPRLETHGDDDIDVMILTLPGDPDPAIELAGTAPAELVHTIGTIIALGDEAAGDPEIAHATEQLAAALGAHVVGSASAASAGVVRPGAVVERGAPFAPELCVAIGAPAIDIAGSASLVRIGSPGGKGVDGALSGPIAINLVELTRVLEDR
jgi:electron transfer flavoprotein alpha subunit